MEMHKMNSLYEEYRKIEKQAWFYIEDRNLKSSQHLLTRVTFCWIYGISSVQRCVDFLILNKCMLTSVYEDGYLSDSMIPDTKFVSYDKAVGR